MPHNEFNSKTGNPHQKMTKPQEIAQKLQELYPLIIEDMKERFGETIAEQAITTLVDLYEAELLDNYK